MKPLLNTILLFFLLTVANNVSAQKLILNPSDAYKLKDDTSFLNKPLKSLLKEFGLPVTFVFANEKRDHGALAYIVFKFANLSELETLRCAGKTPLGIRVFFKEYFDWEKQRGDLLRWTAADAERLGHLTIAAIRIYGETMPQTLAL